VPAAPSEAAMILLNRRSRCPCPSDANKIVSLSTQICFVRDERLPFVYPHELRHKGFEMEDDLAARADAVLVESAPLDHLGLEGVVDSGHQFEGESLPCRMISNRSCEFWLEIHEGLTKCTFKIVVAGMQCVSKSYSFPLTCNMRCGDRSSIISLAVTSIRASQSGGGIGVFSLTLSLSLC
jgi:hypothetical protein